MPITAHCRNCRNALQDDENTDRLCGECTYFTADYRCYDALREEGYTTFQAKLMAGLADPPDPDDD
jgi:hypothetical protein